MQAPERGFLVCIIPIMNLPTEIDLRAPGTRSMVKTVEQAIGMIDHELPTEIARLPRWTFARALQVEAQKTGKTRDLLLAIFAERLSPPRGFSVSRA